MEFSEVLEKRRTYRDYSDREVSDEILSKVISAAFKAPTNDHLRQFEFVVVRGKENIAKVIAPLAKNMAAFKDLVLRLMIPATMTRWQCLPTLSPNSNVC